MKRKLLSVALLAVLSIGLVAACDNEDEDGGNGEYSIAITNKAELQEAWYIGDSTRSISVELSPEGNPTQEVTTGALTVVSSDPSVIAATGLNLSAQSLGEATITVNWHGASDSVNLSVGESTYESIASINAGIKAGTIKDGDTVRFYGKVIGSMEQSTTHLYSGVYLGDGDESLMLYSGQISNLWFDGEEPIYHLGDDIAVAAEVSAYSGFYEFKPSLIVPLDSLATSYTVTTPTVTTLDEAGWNALEYTNVGNLIEMELTYVSGSVSTAASTHSTINCTIGESDVALYVNYHIGTGEVEALAQLIGSLDADDVITVTGVVGWYNTDPEICPQFIYANGKELAPSECVEVPNKVAPTAITVTTIDGDYENVSVPALEELQLTMTVTPTDASRLVTWTSSDETVATVSASGLVSALKEGDVTITATSQLDNNVSGSLTITVTAELNPPAEWTTSGTYLFGVKINGALMYADGGFLYSTSNVVYNNEGSLTSSVHSAVQVAVAAGGDDQSNDDYYLSFTKGSETYYISLVEQTGDNAGKYNLSITTTASSIYYHTTDDGVSYWGNKDGTYFLCYNSSYTCLYASETTSYLSSSPIAKLYDIPSGLATETCETIRWNEQGYTNEQDVTSYTGTAVNITLSQGSHNSSSPKYYQIGAGLRWYSGNTIIFTATENYTIDKIELCFVTGYVDSNGTVDNGEVSVEKLISTITPTSGTESITYTGKATCRCTDFVIYYSSVTQ